MMSFIRNETINIIIKIIAEPSQEASTITQFPAIPIANEVKIPEKPITIIATPKLAPALIPSTNGPASGLRKIVCI